MKEVLCSEKAPDAIGPYSQGIGAGGFLFVSGQLPIDPSTKELVLPEIKTQTEQALQNLTAILAAKGAGLEHVVKTTVYLQNMDDFAGMNEVYAQHFTADCPARAAFEVARLPMRALVEIEAIAYKPE